MVTRPARRPAARFATARLTVLLFVRSFLERPEWLAVALLALALGTSLTTAMVALEREVPHRLQQTLAHAGPSLLVQAPSGDARITAGAVARVDSLWRARGDDGPRATFVLGNIECDRVPLLLAGVRARELTALYPWWSLRGAWPRPGRDECVVGALTAATQHLTLGDSLHVTAPHRAALAVTGILTTGGAEDEQTLVTFTRATKILGSGGDATLIAARPHLPAADLPRLAATLRGAVRGIDATPVQRVADAEEHVLAVVALLLRTAVAVIVVCTALALTATLGTLVVEREREIGVMRAIGAGHARVALLFAGESLVLALAGGGLGFLGGGALAALLGARIFGAAIPLDPALLPVALGISCAMAAAGSILPVERALRVEPAIILRGE